MVGSVAVLIASTFAMRLLSDADWDVTVFAAFGEADVSTRTYAEDRLGGVYLRDDLGHDGRFLFRPVQ